MKLAVTDANIFIDLIKLQLTGFLFNIDLEIHTTQEIVDQLTETQAATLQPFVDAGLLKVTLFRHLKFMQYKNWQCQKHWSLQTKRSYTYQRLSAPPY